MHFRYGAAQWSRHQRREAVVGSSERSHRSVAPVLLSQPLLGVVAVLRFIDVGFPHTLGVIASPHIDQGDSVTAAGKIESPGHLQRADVVAPVGPQQETGKLPGRVGTVDVRRKIDSVPHRDLHVDLDFNRILLRAGFPSWLGRGGDDRDHESQGRQDQNPAPRSWKHLFSGSFRNGSGDAKCFPGNTKLAGSIVSGSWLKQGGRGDRGDILVPHSIFRRTAAGNRRSAVAPPPLRRRL